GDHASSIPSMTCLGLTHHWTSRSRFDFGKSTLIQAVLFPINNDKALKLPKIFKSLYLFPG
ncbi:MAG: hypothetical protein KC584_13750, partial [Nitrospira sp.]|nr:hypothetical protein [Nitrospira sp.]